MKSVVSMKNSSVTIASARKVTLDTKVTALDAHLMPDTAASIKFANVTMVKSGIKTPIPASIPLMTEEGK